MADEVTREYTYREEYLGVPEVEALSYLDVNQRERQTLKVAEFLEACDLPIILEAGERIQHLYSKSATVMARFGIEHVDIYARAAIRALDSQNSISAIKMKQQINQTRRIVSHQKGVSNPSPLVIESPLLTSVD